MSATSKLLPCITTAALALSTLGVTAGCGGRAGANDSVPAGAESREAVAGGEAQAEVAARSTFFDRLLGDRTRDVTVAPGTVLRVRFRETVSSGGSAVGDTFRATVEEDVRVADTVAIPAGSVVMGRVTEAHQPQGVGGRARLSLEFTSLELPSGETAPIDGVFAGRGKSENLEDAAIIAGSTLGGVVLGEAVDKGEGGVIGGILGGLGGALAAKKTKAQAVAVPAGTVMSIELVRPVHLEVPA